VSPNRRKNVALFAPLMAGMLIAPHALGDSWAFRPSLWEMTSSQELLPQVQAWLKAHHMAPPAQQVRKYCWPSGNSDFSKSIFDPANEPPGACHERVLSESDSAREVEDDCNLPTMQTLPAGADPNRVPHIPAEARRHIIKGEPARA
jgi:hypothetical protein